VFWKLTVGLSTDQSTSPPVKVGASSTKRATALAFIVTLQAVHGSIGTLIAVISNSILAGSTDFKILMVN